MSFTDLANLQFENCVKQAKGQDKAFREKAWSEYQRLGLPDRKNEAWKYSSLAALSKADWSAASLSQNVPETVKALLRKWKADFDIAVMINGQMHAPSSRLTLEMGYEFTALQTQPELTYDDGFVSVAAALNRGGYNLRVAPGINFPKPLLIVHCQQGENSWSATLNRITVEKGAHFQLAEIFIGGAETYLRTDITHAALHEGAGLSWVRIQQDSLKASHFSEVQAGLSKSAALSFTQINGGGAWARSSMKVNLNGEHSEAHVNGLSFARGEQHVDQRVQVSHYVGYSVSTQLFKGVLKDHARGVLNGKIYIARDAQKVNSSQLNHNLLLSSTAEADTKPELEIYADDVKANHGASVGRLDEEKLFYLLSRAIPRDEAVQMLAQAFVGDVLMKIPVLTLRELLTERVSEILPEFSTQMEKV